MTEARIAQRRGEREGAARFVHVPSSRLPGVEYRTDPDTGLCDCPRRTPCGLGTKHGAAARALLRLRRSRYAVAGSEASREREEEVLGLCRRIFAPVRAAETPADAYALYGEVAGHALSTPEMRECARRRHARVLAMNEGRGS